MVFDLEPDEARLLLDIALMATGANRFRSSAKILAALERFRPDSPAIASAKAVALVSALRFAECVQYLDGEALRRFPENPMLLAFRGMALLRMDRKDEAEPSLKAAAEQTEDPAAAKLAADLLKG